MLSELLAAPLGQSVGVIAKRDRIVPDCLACFLVEGDSIERPCKSSSVDCTSTDYE